MPPRGAPDSGTQSDGGSKGPATPPLGDGSSAPESGVAHGDASGIGDPLPNNAFCQPVSNWDPAWADLEQQLLVLVNQARAAGAKCGGTSYPPVAPVTMDPALHCAARVLSKEMAVNNFYDHVSPTGEGPIERVTAAGYQFQALGENIDVSKSTAAGTMMAFMNSPGHCSNIMDGTYKKIGIGYYAGGRYGYYWTQDFGSP
jgi:uncharacterized protein YkwD